MSDAAPAPRRPRRGPLALVQDGEEPSGPPSPEERRKVYRVLLRQGEPPAGWVTGQAALWGVGHATVSAELAAAREALAEERTPAGAAARAHELVEQAVELANLIDRAARQRDVAGLEPRLRALKVAAELKLKAAAALGQLGRDAPPAPGVPFYDLGAALRGGLPRRGRAARLAASYPPLPPPDLGAAIQAAKVK